MGFDGKGARNPPQDMSTHLLLPAVWQSLNFKWLWVYYGLVPVTGRWSEEITVPAGWFWVECGEGRIWAGGSEIRVRAGQSFYTAPGMRRQWFADGTRLLSVGFRCQWPCGTPVFQAGLNTTNSAARSRTLLEQTRTLFHSVHGCEREVTYREGIVPGLHGFIGWCRHEAAFREWFVGYVASLHRLGIEAQSPTKAKDRRLKSLLCALHEWPLDQSLQLSKLGEGSGLGGRRVHDLLRAHLGMTAQEWLEQRRLLVARERLAGEETALKEIAFHLGFKHPPHFTAWFKRHTGMTPTAFRAGQGVEGA